MGFITHNGKKFNTNSKGSGEIHQKNDDDLNDFDKGGIFGDMDNPERYPAFLTHDLVKKNGKYYMVPKKNLTQKDIDRRLAIEKRKREEG